MDILYTQESIINSYGMSDPRYEKSYNELLSTFCVRTFKVIMPMVMQVLENMQKNTYMEGDICLSYGPVDLFKFISQIFDGYKYCQQPVICRGILGLCFK